MSTGSRRLAQWRARARWSAASGAILVGGIGLAQDAQQQPAEPTLPPVTVEQPTPKVNPPQPSQQRPVGAAQRRTTSRPTQPRTERPVPTSPTAGGGGAATAQRDGIDGYVTQATAIGTKTSTPILDLPRAVSTVTQQEIFDRDAQSVQEALNYTSGVDTYFRPGNLTREYTLIRGFLAYQYLDGLKLHDSSWGVEPYGLQRIDVLKGPDSTLYGQGSPGGLWDLTSKRPTDQTFAEELLRVGSYGLVQEAFDVGGPVTADHSLLYRVVAMGKFGDAEVNDTKTERVYIAPSFTWRPNSDTSLTVLASYQYDPNLTVLQPLPYAGTVTPGPNGQYISRSLFLGEPSYHDTWIESFRIGYDFQHRFNDIFSFQQDFAFQRLNINLEEVQSRATVVNSTDIVRQMSYQVYDIDIFQVDNRLKADLALGPFVNHVVYGTDFAAIPNYQGTGVNRSSQYLLNLYNPVYGQPLAASNPITSFRYQNQTQLGFYVQDRIEFGNLSLLLGTRYDIVDLDQQIRTLNTATGVLSNPPWTSQPNHAETSNAGLVYDFKSLGLSPYAVYSQSFYPTPGTQFNGAPFIPTTGDQKEAGLKYKPPGWNLLFTTAAFDIVQNNVLTPDLQNPGFQVQNSSIEVKGAEAEFKTTQLYGFNIASAFTYLDPVTTATNTAGGIGKAPVGIPDYSASLWTTYRFRLSPFDGLTVGGGVRYVGQSWADALNTMPVPAFTLFDLALHYQLGSISPTMANWDMGFNIKNLFDKRYVSSCDDALDCYYGPGRTFDLVLRGRF
jgi:iron complex outermembrane recepter protein